MKFDEFAKIGKSQQQTAPGVPVDGTFGCQLCEEVVYEAEFYLDTRMLVWYCPANHQSYIEDFKI